LQDIELLDLEDYRHNFVNLTGFRLVNSDDQFTKKVLDEMNYFRENTQLNILNNTALPVRALYPH